MRKLVLLVLGSMIWLGGILLGARAVSGDEGTAVVVTVAVALFLTGSWAVIDSDPRPRPVDWAVIVALVLGFLGLFAGPLAWAFFVPLAFSIMFVLLGAVIVRVGLGR